MSIEKKMNESGIHSFNMDRKEYVLELLRFNGVKNFSSYVNELIELDIEYQLENGDFDKLPRNLIKRLNGE